MKGYFSVFVLLALALVIDARIKDESIKEEYEDCKSELRVKILGKGAASLTKRARSKCKKECDRGVERYKIDKCNDLCGVEDEDDDRDDDDAEACYLCSPNRSKHIEKCKEVIEDGRQICRDDCDDPNNKPTSEGGKKVVRGTSGAIKLTFPSVNE